MGIYKKAGIRAVALKFVEFITWMRLYGLKEGFKLFISSSTLNKGYYYINASFLPQPFRLRNNYSDKAIFLQVFLEKQYELYNVEFPQPTVIVDGGANIGASVVYFSILFPNANIFAVEPEESNYNLLKENTKQYKNINCIQAGIWNKNEFINISNPDSLPAGFIVQSNNTSGKQIQGITIDSLIEQYGWDKIDILKLDIESAEKEVFSANNLDWLKNIKVLIIEVHDFYKEGCTKALFNAISKYDYKAYFHHENIFIFFKPIQ